MATFEFEAVQRAVALHHIEQALTAIARLPDHEGRSIVLTLNLARSQLAETPAQEGAPCDQGRESRPVLLRLVPGQFQRARRTWGSDRCYAGAEGLPEDGPGAA